ncbi:hypothetical protein [Halegenticoccus tardaugens]|uniref:hypothetical protein n=1 Tax=Halegenticoccus tardaugens TaxID=2071624 RepID=UPI00100A4A8E|nr:hypothetical protein [Halegenticoccus tardaugens]
MRAIGRTTVERLRQPEYTGENRCPPCTVVNLLLAALGSVAIGSLAPVAGVAFALVAVAAIYLRGYLVPGTPELTKRHLPDRVLRWFGKDPHVGTSVDLDGDNAVSSTDLDGDNAVSPSHLDVESRLLSIGAVEPAGEDLRAAPSFEREWRRAAEEVLDAPERRAGDVLGLSEPGIEDRGGVCVVADGGIEAARWPSREALVADLAAVPLLRERLSDWESLDRATQGRLLAGLRVFLTFCPTCGGVPAFREDTVESCCRSVDVVTYDCEDCGARLLELQR